MKTRTLNRASFLYSFRFENMVGGRKLSYLLDSLGFIVLALAY